MAPVGTSPQDGDHGVGGGELVFEVDDAYGGVHADAFVDELSGAVGALQVVAAAAARRWSGGRRTGRRLRRSVGMRGLTPRAWAAAPMA
jgi:hypothetical protein